MATVWVVPSFDVLEDRHAGLGLAMEYAPVDELAFEGGEEALGHCVVKAVAHRTHRRYDAHLTAAFPERVRRILAAYWSDARRYPRAGRKPEPPSQDGSSAKRRKGAEGSSSRRG